MPYISKDAIGIMIKMENLIGMNEHYLFGYGDNKYENQGRNCPPESFGQIKHEDFTEFMSIIEKAIQDTAKTAEKSKESMRKFRSTPEGRERSRKASRESARRKRERKKQGN